MNIKLPTDGDLKNNDIVFLSDKIMKRTEYSRARYIGHYIVKKFDPLRLSNKTTDIRCLHCDLPCQLLNDCMHCSVGQLYFKKLKLEV